jgi:16S rRNA (cytosine967-C5)-methyltransferase
MTPEQVANLADGSRHAPQPLSEAELAGLKAEIPATAPAHVRGDFPEWLEAEFDRAFGARAADQGAGLARRAPVDLRANTLKADRDKVLKALRRFEAVPTPLSPFGVRVAQGPGPSRNPHLEAEPGHGKAGTSSGWFAARDASAGAGPPASHDFCAGAGGKTFELAA